MQGWIKLHRKFIEWEWFSVDEMVKLFIYLLLSANHEDGNFQGVEVKRGQVITGLNRLSFNTGISIQTLRTCLKRLEKTAEINIQSTNKFSIITICNYDTYQTEQQSTNNQPNKPLTNNQQATNKQLTTNKNDNNVENDNNENNTVNKPKRFVKPTIEEIKAYCIERKNNVDAEHFYNKYEANGWKVGNVGMKNWKSAIITWEKNNFNNTQNGTPKPSKNGSYD